MTDATSPVPDDITERRMRAQVKRAEAIPDTLMPLAFLPPTMLADAKQRGWYSEHLAAAKETSLLACFPRSGSTFTFLVTRTLMGYVRADLAYARGRSDHDLYMPAVFAALPKPSIAQHHLRATNSNIDIINFFDIKTIVLVRNLFDVFASLFDAARAQKVDKAGANGEGIMMDSTAADLDDEALMDLIIHSRLSWYMNFFVSWSYALNRNHMRGHLTSYEAMVADPIAYFGGIATFLGRPAEPETIETAIATVRAQGSHRLSKGVTGRGRGMMSPRQIDRLEEVGRHYATYYPWLDLALIGLAP